MNHLIHLCKKDLTCAKPWILGTWLAFGISNLQPWITQKDEAAMAFVFIRLLAPAVMIFLTCARIIHCDAFVGTSGFMRSRPVSPTSLLGQKLVFIAALLVLPAVGFALLQAVCLRVQLSASEYLLLFIEKWLYFSLIAGVAVVFSVISRRVGVMVFYIAGASGILALYGAYVAPGKTFGTSMEDQHLLASLWLVAQVLLPVAALVIAMSWVTQRRIGLTVAVFLLSAGVLTLLLKQWHWNFVDELSKDATSAESVTWHPAIQWMEPPSVIPTYVMKSIPYSRVSRIGHMTGFKDGWTGRLAKFQSEARFADGTVLQSKGDSELALFDYIAPTILPQLGIQVPEDDPMRLYEKSWSWTLFECETSRLQERPEHRAAIRGICTFQLYQPVVLVELPAQAGASTVVGRFIYRIDSLNASDGQISAIVSIHGVALRSMGDSARAPLPMELLFVNPGTRQFTCTRRSGVGSGHTLSGDWIRISDSVLIDRKSAKPVNAGKFLKGARLYVLGTRYGGTITLPYETPEMQLIPVAAIEYPYEASKQRRDRIVSQLESIKVGMNDRAVIDLIGQPDETTPLFEPKIKNAKQIGTTMWYILSQRKKDGSENDIKRVAVGVRLDSHASVSRVDRINLPIAATPAVSGKRE